MSVIQYAQFVERRDSMIKPLLTSQANTHFYADMPWYAKLLHIYVKGDSVVLVPFLALIVLVGFFWSWSYMFLVLAIFHTIRSLGEMMFWLMQQFGAHTYRPYDFGLTKLNTNAIYILYQVYACVQAVIGIVCSVFVYTELILR